jgi:hypothetical protein
MPAGYALGIHCRSETAGIQLIATRSFSCRRSGVSVGSEHDAAGNSCNLTSDLVGGDLPPPYAEWRAGWIANHHPDWTHRLYDEAAIRHVLADRAPQWLPTFDTFPRMIQRVDFFRYLIIYVDGGLYADVDMISYLPCDPLLKKASCALSIENHLGKHLQTKLGYQQPWQLANFVLAAVPGHPFFAPLLKEIARSAAMAAPNDDCVEDISGPRMLTRQLCIMKSEE